MSDDVSMFRVNNRPVIKHPAKRLVFEEGTSLAVMDALSSIPTDVRLNVWFGNPDSGQSYGHEKARLGVFVKYRSLISLGELSAGDLNCIRLVRRIGSAYDFALPHESVVMVTTANGSRVIYQHPSYRPVYDWERARIVRDVRDTESGISIVAPRNGELDEQLAHGLLATSKAASQFLKVARLTDKPPHHEHTEHTISEG